MSADEQAGGRPVPPIVKARNMTEQVREQLEVAGAELHLTNSMLGRNLEAQGNRGEVRKALDQYARVEEKVVDAAEELNAVTERLEEEIAERQQLELELERLAAGAQG